MDFAHSSFKLREATCNLIKSKGKLFKYSHGSLNWTTVRSFCFLNPKSYSSSVSMDSQLTKTLLVIYIMNLWCFHCPSSSSLIFSVLVKDSMILPYFTKLMFKCCQLRLSSHQHNVKIRMIIITSWKQERFALSIDYHFSLDYLKLHAFQFFEHIQYWRHDKK